MAHVGKRAIAVVVIQRQRHPGINCLNAIGTLAIEFAYPRNVEVNLRIVADEQVEIAIAVIVKPDRTGRPSALVLYAGLFRDIRKSTVAVIVKERGSRCSGHVQIGVTIVVIVGCRDPHSIERQAVNGGLRSDILKFSVSQIVIERISYWPRTLSLRSLTAIYKKNVEKTVTIVINEGHAAARSFNHEAVG